jgi:organic hydroperoxide reductase OsmC/OhrA
MSIPSTHSTHAYLTHLEWTGNLGQGTARYTEYARSFRATVKGKPPLMLSADAAFRGDPALHNPEDLLVAAIAGCHMLFYLALCARHGVQVLAYSDNATGTMTLDPDGSGRFTGVELNPAVELASGSDEALAQRLHDTAHQRCFIANSCRVPIRHRATIRVSRPAATPVRGGVL